MNTDEFIIKYARDYAGVEPPAIVGLPEASDEKKYRDTIIALSDAVSDLVNAINDIALLSKELQDENDKMRKELGLFPEETDESSVSYIEHNERANAYFAGAYANFISQSMKEDGEND